MAPRRPCPSCATVCSRWNPKHLKNMASVRILITGIGCFIGMYFNTVIQVFAQTRSDVFQKIPTKYNMSKADRAIINTLPDLGFDILPFLPEAWIADYMVLFLMFVTLIRFTPTKMGPTIFRR